MAPIVKQRADGNTRLIAVLRMPSASASFRPERQIVQGGFERSLKAGGFFITD
jgi:hypothetical protein